MCSRLGDELVELLDSSSWSVSNFSSLFGTSSVPSECPRLCDLMNDLMLLRVWLCCAGVGAAWLLLAGNSYSLAGCFRPWCQ